MVLSLIPGITICCLDFEISILQWSQFPSLCCNPLYTIKTSIVLILPFTFEDTVKSLTCLGVTVKLVAGLQDAQGEPHRDLHTPGPRQACLTKRTFPALCRELSVLSASLSAISVPWLALGHSRSFHMVSLNLLSCRLWSTQVARPAQFHICEEGAHNIAGVWYPGTNSYKVGNKRRGLASHNRLGKAYPQRPENLPQGPCLTGFHLCPAMTPGNKAHSTWALADTQEPHNSSFFTWLFAIPSRICILHTSGQHLNQ